MASKGGLMAEVAQFCRSLLKSAKGKSGITEKQSNCTYRVRVRPPVMDF
jgi:hypothetical protein